MPVLDSLPVTLADAYAARERISGVVLRTPLLPSESLSRLTGAEVLLKCETLQHGGAFKFRGASNAVFSLTEEEAVRGVITHSSGNHASALVRAAQRRGVPVEIVMPETSMPAKLQAVRALGVTPILCGPSTEERTEAACKRIAETGAVLIHPYDAEPIIAGQATCGLELLEQAEEMSAPERATDAPPVDDVIVPVGGGGLLSGTLIAVKSLFPSVRVFGAEPEWADDAFRSLASSTQEYPTRYDTVADGLRTAVGSRPLRILRELVDGVLTCSEAEIISATKRLIREARLVVEPSAAVAFAVLLANRERFAGRRVALVLTGGNLDAAAFFREHGD